MRINSTDWIPRCEDAGYDALIASLAPRGLSGREFVAQLNTQGSQMAWSEDMLAQYIADRQHAGALGTVEVVDYRPVTPVERHAAPAAIGGSVAGEAFWVTDTVAPTDTVYWYVNGEFRVAKHEASVALADLQPLEIGYFLQACFVVEGVVGWWTRIEVSA